MRLRFAPVVASVATVVLSAGLVLSASPAVAAGSDPKPIPGGFVPFPGAPFIHVFAPGPADLGFMGEDVEPNTITNFRGFSALAYIAGTATDADGRLQTEADWKCIPTLVKRGASIGSSATLLCGITVGEYAIVGAGSVVTRDVPPYGVVVGNPAKVLKMLPKKRQ